ncbi:MAG: DUF6265 family protein [Bacteroidota bacterium]
MKQINHALPFLPCLMLLLLCSQCIGQSSRKTLDLPEGESSPPATIEEVAWISGYWKGEEGETEEIWAPPSGHSMMGSFKQIKDGEVSFYELCTITEEEGSLMLRIKHFSGKLIGWEEKEDREEFALVKLAEKQAFFNGFTFELVNQDELHLHVVVNTTEEGPQEASFVYKRARL